MSKYLVRNNVPILDEHALTDDAGNVLVQIDEAKLHRIAARNNKRVRETGDLVPLVIGHTKDDAPETQQPEIVGYAKDFRVRPFKKTGRKAVHAKFLFFKDKAGKAKRFPRRSVELWLSDWKLDPISLLGATTPERDLGLLQLSKRGAVLQYAADGRKILKRLVDDKPMDDQKIVDGVLAALKESAVWKWAESQMKEDTARGDEGDLDSADMSDKDMDDLDEESVHGGEPRDDRVDEEGDLDDDLGEGKDEEGEEPVRYNQGGAAPSGSNTFTPGTGMVRQKSPSHSTKKSFCMYGNDGKMSGSRKAAPVANPSGPQKLSRSRNDLVQFQKTLREQSRQMQDLRLRYQRSEREKDLMQLAAEGYEFDHVEELDHVTRLNDDQYAHHLSRIRRRYQRAPIGDARFDLAQARDPRPASEGRTRQEAAQVAAYAAKKGISYEEALDSFEPSY